MTENDLTHRIWENRIRAIRFALHGENDIAADYRKKAEELTESRRAWGGESERDKDFRE